MEVVVTGGGQHRGLRFTRRMMGPRLALTALALTPLSALTGTAGSAAAFSPGCGEVPIVNGIPPWGFHTGSPGEESYARGHGQINLEANTVHGVICQQDGHGDITMTVQPHLLFHSHYAVLWGFPGNIMRITTRVRASEDPKCKVGAVGQATLFASYNGVRSDSVRFFFPTCRDQDHVYHGTQVNNQVPPL